MPKLKLAYNYHLTQGSGGIPEYSRGLLNSLSKITDKELDFFLFYNSLRGNFPDLSNALKEKGRLIKTRFPLTSLTRLNYGFKYKFLYPYLCRKYKIDIFHGTELISIAAKNIISVSTVHDIFFKLKPYLANSDHCRYLRRIFSELNRYNAIIAMSGNTKDDLIRFGIAPEKITVIYRGLNEVFLNFANIAEEKRIKEIILLKKKYSLPEKYFLYVGNFVPRKNVPRLIDIFHRYCQSRKTNIKLVLVGPGYGEDYLKVKAQINRISREKDILFIGYVAEEELPYIYSGAEIFFFLSLYEGFGMPALEAMAVGTPAIVADNSSLRELTKGYAFLVDPENDQQIFDAIDKILDNQAQIREITRKAAEYVRRFNWNKTAQETIDLYKKVAGKVH